MKAIKQTNEGADLLDDDFGLLTAILFIAQALYTNFRKLKIFAHGFPSAKSTKVLSRESLYAYGMYCRNKDHMRHSRYYLYSVCRNPHT